MTTTAIFTNFSIAVAAIISPFWLDILKDVSQVAAALLPFFGIALAILQIIKLRNDKRNDKGN